MIGDAMHNGEESWNGDIAECIVQASCTDVESEFFTVICTLVDISTLTLTAPT